MYLVSDAFKLAMKDPQHVEHVRGTVGGVSFTDDNIAALSYSNICTDTKDVKFGSARIGQLTAHFINMAITRGDWRGLTLTLEYGLTLADSSVEYIPVGTFTIAKADWTDTGVKITAYDCISAFDVAFTLSSTSGRIFDYCEMLATLTGISNGRTVDECLTLPNGSEVLGLYPENDIKTARDFLSWVASAVGGFATAGRDNKFVIRSFAEAQVVDAFTSRDRVVGSVFSDYITQYDGVTFTNNDGTIEYYQGTGSTGGVSIALGANPLMQYGTSAVKARQRQTLADVAVGIHYTPFNIAILNCPVYDLGDLIECSGGVAGEDTLTCCVMGIDWTFKQTMTLKGYGADPNLTAGKTSTDRALQGLSNQTKENELVTHTYINAMPYTLSNHIAQEVASISFATTQPRKVLILTEIMADITVTDTDNGAAVTLLYYLDGNLESYQPVGTFFKDGVQTLPRIYFFNNLEAGVAYDWSVEVKVDGGTATIDRGCVREVLQGQGLVAVDEFTGIIRCEDIYAPVELDHEIATYTEALELFIRTIEVDFAITDTINTAGIGERQLVMLSDACALDIATSAFNIVDETDTYNVVDETGDYFIINEEGL